MCAAAGDAYDRTVVERRDPLLGTVLDGRFQIDSQLAAGGFGAIYRATDVRSDAEIALKVLHPQLARDPSVVARFRREGKTLANLRDPHTINAYELGEAPDGTLYIVMELLHGETLYHRFRTRGPLPWRQVLHIALGVCSSLAEAHAAGIVHRDLKPANIHLENRDGDPDFVKVLDFGIAKIVQGNPIDRTELTQAGTMIGTVEYMSPEQMVGGEMTPASDVYTLGVVMYEMIAGRTPFADAQTATAILAALLTQLPEPLSRHAEVPPALDRILARCLDRDLSQRFSDITELADALSSVLGSVGRRRRELAEIHDTLEISELSTSPVAARPAPVFDPISTAESTRIDWQPVADRRPRPSAGPAPDATRARPPTPAPPVARPVMPTPLPAAPRAVMPTPLPAARRARPPTPGPPVPRARPVTPPPPRPRHPAMAAPRERAPTHTIRRYDLAEVATRDALVRRIIWISLAVALALGLLIATR